jgi:hypothetical protein
MLDYSSRNCGQSQDKVRVQTKNLAVPIDLEKPKALILICHKCGKKHDGLFRSDDNTWKCANCKPAEIKRSDPITA